MKTQNFNTNMMGALWEPYGNLVGTCWEAYGNPMGMESKVNFAKFANFANFATSYFARVAALLLMVLTLGVGEAWGENSGSATQTFQDGGLTSVWTNLNFAIDQNGAYGANGLYFEAGSGGSITTSSNAVNIKDGRILYVQVPSASSSGNIRIVGNSNQTDRFVKLLSDKKIANISGVGASQSFSASDVVNVNAGYYIKVTSASDFKFTSVSVTLNNGDHYNSGTGSLQDIYLNPGGASLWNQEGATFCVYWWTANSSGFAPMEASCTDGVYVTKIPSTVLQCKFLRMNSSSAYYRFSISGDNFVWNEVGDQTIVAGKQCTITGWSACNWNVDAPDCTPVAANYYISGTNFGGWGATQNLMTDNGDGTYTWTSESKDAGNYDFKITDGSWEHTSWGCGALNTLTNCTKNCANDGDNASITTTAAGPITFVFVESTKKINVTGPAAAATCTITFDKNDGSGTTATQVIQKATETALTTFAVLGWNRDGWAFAGWNTNEAGTGTNYADGASITRSYDLTLYAKWKKQHTITFDNQDGNKYAGVASLVVTMGSKANIASNETTPIAIDKPQKYGYTFMGYYTEPAGTGSGSQIIGADGNFKKVSGYVTDQYNWSKDEDITLYARWQCNVTLNKNHLEATSNGAGTMVYKQKSISISSDPVRENYHPYGAFYAEAGMTTLVAHKDGTLVKAATTYTNSDGAWIYSPNTDDEIVLYTRWVHDNVTVTFNQTGADKKATTQSKSVDFENPLSASANDAYVPQKFNYDFAGYWSVEGGTGVLIMNPNGSWVENATDYIVDRMWQVQTNTTIYPKWTPCVNTIKFDQNSGPGAAPADITYTYGDAAPSLPAYPSTRTGYTFSGWNTKSDGTGTTYDASSVWAHTGKTETIKLYAKWTPNSYTVTLDNQEATTAGAANVTVTYGSNSNIANDDPIAPVDIEMPEKTGYTFGGYYTAAEGAGLQIIDADGHFIANVSGYTDANYNWKNASDVTLYAKWTDNAEPCASAVKNGTPASLSDIEVNGVVLVDILVSQSTNQLTFDSKGIKFQSSKSELKLTLTNAIFAVGTRIEIEYKNGSNSNATGLAIFDDSNKENPIEYFAADGIAKGASGTLSKTIDGSHTSYLGSRSIRITRNGGAGLLAISAIRIYNCGEETTWQIAGSITGQSGDDAWKPIDLTDNSYYEVNLGASTNYTFKLVKDVNGAKTWYTMPSPRSITATTSDITFEDGDGFGNETTLRTADAGVYRIDVNTEGSYPVVTVTYPTPVPVVAENYYIYLGQTLTLSDGVTATYGEDDKTASTPAYYYDQLSQTTKQYSADGALTCSSNTVTGNTLGQYRITLTGGSRATANVYVYRYYAKYPWGACSSEPQADYNKTWKWQALSFKSGNTLNVVGLYSHAVENHANVAWDYYYDWDGVYKFNGDGTPDQHPGVDGTSNGVWLDDNFANKANAKDHGASDYKTIPAVAPALNCANGDYIGLNYTPTMEICGSTEPTLTNNYETYNANSEVTTYYTLTYAIKPDALASAAGTITHDASADKVASGTEVTFTATEKTGYHFAGWYSDAACETQITGESVDAAKKTHKATITANYAVYAKYEKVVTEIEISAEGGVNTMVVGGSDLQLSVAFTPEDATYSRDITWTSDNTSFLTVTNEGLVHAVAAGTGHYITATTGNGVTNTYYINVIGSDCSGTWQVHMWNTEQHTNRSVCLTQVGETHEWRSAQVILPSNSDAEKLKVLYNGGDVAGSAEWTVRHTPMVDHGGDQYYAGQDAIGYFRIWDDNETADGNRSLAFEPIYRITYGIDGSGGWVGYDFHATGVGNAYRTDIVQVPEGYFSNDNFKFYVGTKKNDGGTFFVAKNDAVANDKSQTVALKTMVGLNTDRGGEYGYFRIYNNSNQPNWYCEFIPYDCTPQVMYDFECWEPETLNATKSQGGLTVTAAENISENRDVIIQEQGATIDGKSFTHRADLRGQAKYVNGAALRTLSIDVDGPCTIDVYAVAPSARTLNVYAVDNLADWNTSTATITTLAVPTTASKLSFNYEGVAKTLVFSSSNSGIYVYGIDVNETAPDANCNTVTNTTEVSETFSDGTILYSIDSNGRENGTTKFGSEKIKGEPTATPVLSDQRLAVKFPVAVSAVEIHAWSSSSGRTLSSEVRKSTTMERGSYSLVTCTTNSESTTPNHTYTFTATFSEDVAANTALWFAFNNAVKVYEICYTPAAVLPSCTTPILNALDPAPQTVCVGSDAESWTASVSNQAAIDAAGETVTYTWTHGGRQVATGATLSLTNVNLSMGGTYTVTATVSKAGYKDATASTTATLNVPNPTISQADELDEIRVGDTLTLTAAAGGTWSSEQPGVATVNASGVVRGVAAGTATITYTLNGCTATYTVTVEAVVSDPVFTWKKGETVFTSGNLRLSAGGYYNISVTTSAGAPAPAISLTPVTGVTFTPDPSDASRGTLYITPACESDEIVLTATSVANVSFSAKTEDVTINVENCGSSEITSAGKIPMATYTDRGSSETPRYVNENSLGWLGYKTCTTYTTEDASFAGFSTRNSSSQTLYMFSNAMDNVAAVRFYVHATNDATAIGSVYQSDTYFADKSKATEVSVTCTYLDAAGTEIGSNNMPASKNNYSVMVGFPTPLSANTVSQVIFSKNVKVYGIEFYTAQDMNASANLPTTLGWKDPAPTSTVEKTTTDMPFQYEAAATGANSNTLGAVTYKSSNTSVATVSSTGTVTIVGAGTTTITATLAASGCYRKADASYELTVTQVVIEDPRDVIVTTTSEYTNKCPSASVTMTAAYESTNSGVIPVGATYQWYKDNKAISGATDKLYTTAAEGTYTVVVTRTNAIKSTNSIKITNRATATVRALYDYWYIKQGRKTPDLAVFEIDDPSGTAVVTLPANVAGKYSFYRDGDVVYLSGTAPTGITAEDSVTATIRVNDGCGNVSANMTLRLKPATGTPELAFVTANDDHVNDADTNDDAWTTCKAAQTTALSLYTELSNVYSIQATNIYASNDEAKVRAYYSQFDILLITDFPNTKKVAVKGQDYKTQGFVNALGSMVDIRPILTMEAFVSALENWQTKGDPKNTAVQQFDMLLMCQTHEIFAGTHYDMENIEGVDYYKVNMVNSENFPAATQAVQGFAASDLGEMVVIGKTHDVAHSNEETNSDLLMACVERQVVSDARMMVLGVNANSLQYLTKDGEKIIMNSLAYLLKDGEDISDCALIFDNGAGNTDPEAIAKKGDNRWDNPENWGPNYNSLPIATNEVRIIANCTIPDGVFPHVAYAKIKDDVTLTISDGAALTVDGMVRMVSGTNYMATEDTKASQIRIESSATGNGALIHNDASGKTNATVQMYSPASGAPNPGLTWQWMTTPFNHVDAAETNYLWSWMREYNSGSHTWVDMHNGSSMEAFGGYEITQASATTYEMTGSLVSTKNRVIALNKGLNVIGNSWTAPINISQFRERDFKDAEMTIVMLNTGLDANGGGNVTSYAGGTIESEDVRTPGTYVSIPVRVASNLKPALQVIPSMQSFQIRTNSTPDNGHTISLNYDQLVRPKSGNVNIQPMRAPSRKAGIENEQMESLRIYVKGSHYGDYLYIFRNEETTMGFDNGWDGRKYMTTDNTAIPALIVRADNLNWQISTQPQFSGTQLGFYQGEDTTYTMGFTYQGGERLWLYDSNTDNYTLVHNDSTYTFTSTSGRKMQSRFVLTDYNPYYVEPVIPEIPDEPSDPIVTELTHVTVDGNMLTFTNATHKPMSIAVYDAAGKLVTRTTTEAPLYQVELSDVQGVYMVHMSAGDKKIVTKVVR